MNRQRVESLLLLLLLLHSNWRECLGETFLQELIVGPPCIEHNVGHKMAQTGNSANTDTCKHVLHVYQTGAQGPARKVVQIADFTGEYAEGNVYKISDEIPCLLIACGYNTHQS